MSLPSCLCGSGGPFRSTSIRHGDNQNRSDLFLSSKRHLYTTAMLVSRRFSWDVNKTKHITYWPQIVRTLVDQMKNSIQIQLDESLNLLGWLTGLWMTERRLHHQEVALVANMYSKSPTHPLCRWLAKTCALKSLLPRLGTYTAKVNCFTFT